ncbi:XkdX family protein [Latilactobacillus curvatus]|nr:XkdX family protein [Latilactobacillus curvatus]MCP8849195.1 XkdX family protein [Latilactobacillus curvatus]
MMNKEYITFLYSHGELDLDYLKLAVEFGQLTQSEYDEIVKET